MILSWLLYCSAVGVLFAAAAGFLEIAFRDRGWPIRPVWIASLLALLLVPALAATVGRPPPEAPIYTFLPADGPTSQSDPVPVGTASALASTTAAALPSVTREVLEPWLVRGWWIASSLVGVSFVVAFLSLRRSRRAWRREEVDGHTVWVSPDVGPAVVGAFPGSVVIPEWVLSIAPAQRQLILRHEQEHVAARDAPLLFGVLLLRIALPWNPALWWVGRSLRHAIEIDCDRRVLASGADARAYGRLLLDVSARGTAHHFAIAALSEPPSFLERRIRLMISHPAPRRVPRLTATVVLAIAAAVAACRMDRPDAQPIVATGFSMPPAEALPDSADAATGEVASVRPVTPAPTREALRDSFQLTFQRILEAHHPEVLSGDLGGDDRISLYALINGNGDLVHSEVDTEARSGSCMASLASGLGMELNRQAVAGGGCGRLDAGVAGPRPVSFYWAAYKAETEQQRLAPTGPYQIARLVETSRPSREMIEAAVREHFPDVYARGLPQGEGLWFVGDEYHRVVHSGRGWEQPSSTAAQEEVERALPGIALNGGLMTSVRSAADTPIGIYWARLASPGAPPIERPANPFPAALTFAVTTSEPGREVQIRLAGEAAADQRAFRISGKFTNDDGLLTAITPFTFIVMSAEPFQATLQLQGEGEMRIVTETDGDRARVVAPEMTIGRGQAGEAPTFVAARGGRIIPTPQP